MMLAAVGLGLVTLAILLTVFSGPFLQTELFEEEWYESIESVILAATGIFFSPVTSIVNFGVQKNTCKENSICCNCIFSFCYSTNIKFFRGGLWYFGRASNW
jgi:hypothetical protein